MKLFSVLRHMKYCFPPESRPRTLAKILPWESACKSVKCYSKAELNSQPMKACPIFLLFTTFLIGCSAPQPARPLGRTSSFENERIKREPAHPVESPRRRYSFGWNANDPMEIERHTFPGRFHGSFYVHFSRNDGKVVLVEPATWYFQKPHRGPKTPIDNIPPIRLLLEKSANDVEQMLGKPAERFPHSYFYTIH